mmetsp:Transcript_1203/g.1602  ORF Transcript_1203/g.1602 Transcript_1203/m.1602 type:complete len:83 (-) Transcript_1203:102-350(-)
MHSMEVEWPEKGKIAESNRRCIYPPEGQCPVEASSSCRSSWLLKVEARSLPVSIFQEMLFKGSIGCSPFALLSSTSNFGIMW